MLHFDGHTLSIKNVTFAMKSGEYFEKDNNYGVNFDSGICHGIYPCKEYMTSQPSCIHCTSNLNFWVKI